MALQKIEIFFMKKVYLLENVFKQIPVVVLNKYPFFHAIRPAALRGKRQILVAASGC